MIAEWFSARPVSFWIAQGVCLAGYLLSCVSYLTRNKTKYLFLQVGVNLLYGVQYTLLAAWAGVVNNAVFVGKLLVFGCYSGHGREAPRTLGIVFCLASVVFGIYAWTDWFSLIPIVAATAYTYAVWQDRQWVLRLIVVLCDALWIVYNVHVGAWVAALGSAVELVVTALTLIRLIRRGHSQTLPEGTRPAD